MLLFVQTGLTRSFWPEGRWKIEALTRRFMSRIFCFAKTTAIGAAITRVRTIGQRRVAL